MRTVVIDMKAYIAQLVKHQFIVHAPLFNIDLRICGPITLDSLYSCFGMCRVISLEMIHAVYVAVDKTYAIGIR